MRSRTATDNFNRSLMRQLFLQGKDVQWIDGVDLIVLANYHDDALAHGHKFRMRHGELSAVGKMNDERFEPPGNQFFDPLYVHACNL
jgi:hypothetical protein